MAQARTPTQRQQVGPTWWEITMRRPPADLAPYIVDACGYVERTAGPLARREFPWPNVPVLFEFGPPIVTYDAGDRRRPERHRGGFVAGISERYTLTEHSGYQRGLQWNLTPLGARLFFGLPLAELSGRVVALADLGGVHASLTERLEALPDWDTRFEWLDDQMRAALAHARPPASLDLVRFGRERIVASGGAIDIAALNRQLGYSGKHVIELFREHVGVPPKLYARIVRFHGLMEHLKRGGGGSWAELAGRFGYFDQSHLARDVRAFAGATPTEARGMLVDLDALTALSEEPLRAAR